MIEYKLLIKKYANLFSRTSNLWVDDLEQQGILLVLEAMASWEPSQGPLPSRVKYKLCTGLRDYVKKYDPNCNDEYQDWDHETEKDSPERLLLFRESLSLLSEDTKKVVDILFNDGIDVNKTPKAVRGQIIQALRDRDYAWSQVWNCFSELRMLARSI